ncbi:MAG: hypothetical protein IPO21_00905 [Bacteroidales bacterium]|nr:hypothetical protein [Bacteroidales bacterium]
MKKTRKIITVSILLLSSIISYGQKLCLDSINVQIDNKIELSLSIYEYSNLVENIEKDLQSLHSILKDNKEIPENGSYSILYEPDKLLSIKQTGPIEKIIWENGKQTRYQFNNQCNINSNNYYLKIQYNELEKVVSDSLIIKIKQVIDSTSTIKGRLSKTLNYSFQGNCVTHNEQFDKINGQKDAIFFKGGVGVNLIKNQPVIDLALEIGFAFSKKGILKNQIYLSYNQLIVYNDNSIFNINSNSFFNLGYRYNLSNTFKNPNWIGLELGYLVSKEGNFFGKNTFKFGVNWEVGKYITISPQLYFSVDLLLCPAIRIGFGL